MNAVAGGWLSPLDSPVAGTINILALAGRRGLLDFHDVVTELRERTNFHVREDVIAKAWVLAGESGA